MTNKTEQDNFTVEALDEIVAPRSKAMALLQGGIAALGVCLGVGC